MKKIILLFTASLFLNFFFSSCEKDDEVFEVEEITVTDALLTLEDIGDDLKIAKFSAMITGNPETLILKFYPGGMNLVMTENGGVYMGERSFTQEEIHNETVVYGEIIANDIRVSTNSEVVVWENEPNDEFQTVRFTTIERIEIFGENPKYRLGFSDKSDTGDNNEITIELWKAGVDQGVTMDRNLIQATGFIETDQLDLVDDSEYQFRVINKENQIPPFKFLDINDNLNDSHVYSFTGESNSVDINVNSLNFHNVIDTSLEAHLDVDVGGTTLPEIVAKLYKTSDLNTVLQTQNYQTVMGNQVFISQFDGLDSDTSYTVRYFIENNQFHEGTRKTAEAGSYDVEIESTSVTVNDVSVVVEYDNTTGSNIAGEVVFTGIAYVDGGDLVYSEPIELLNGNVDFDVDLEKSGFHQNSSVNIQVIVSGNVEAEITVTTDIISYSMEEISGGAIMTNNQGSTLVATLIFVANGYGRINNSNLEHTFPVTLDYNAYNDNTRVGSSQIIDATWEGNPAIGIWTYILSNEEMIVPGNNSFDVYVGTEVYSPSDGAGTSDDGILKINMTDDNNFNIGAGADGVLIQYQ